MRDQKQVAQIEPRELQALLSSGARVFLLDVREPEEHQLVNIANSCLVPLMQLEQEFENIVSQTQLAEHAIVYCRVGGRSALAIRWLEDRGLAGVLNLRGGINAYAVEADTTLKPY